MVQYFFRFSSFFSLKVSESDALGLDVAAVGAYHYVELARLEEEIAVEIIVTETLLVQTKTVHLPLIHGKHIAWQTQKQQCQANNSLHRLFSPCLFMYSP